MIKAKSLANAAAVIWAIAYALCAIISHATPDLYWKFVNIWVHSMNLELIKRPDIFEIDTFLFGLVTFCLFVWVMVYFSARLYNRFSKGKA